MQKQCPFAESRADVPGGPQHPLPDSLLPGREPNRTQGSHIKNRLSRLEPLQSPLPEHSPMAVTTPGPAQVTQHHQVPGTLPQAQSSFPPSQSGVSPQGERRGRHPSVEPLLLCSFGVPASPGATEGLRPSRSRSQAFLREGRRLLAVSFSNLRVRRAPGRLAGRRVRLSESGVGLQGWSTAFPLSEKDAQKTPTEHLEGIWLLCVGKSAARTLLGDIKSSSVICTAVGTCYTWEIFLG